MKKKLANTHVGNSNLFVKVYFVGQSEYTSRGLVTFLEEEEWLIVLWRGRGAKRSSELEERMDEWRGGGAREK